MRPLPGAGAPNCTSATRARGCFRFVERPVTVLRPDRRQRDERPITRRDILAALGLFGDHLGKLATAQHRLMTEAA